MLVGGALVQSMGVTQQVPGPGGPHGSEPGRTCEQNVPGTLQSSAVVHARAPAPHCPNALAATPFCFRTQSFQYVTSSHPQTGAALKSHKTGRGSHEPEAAKQSDFEQVQPTGQSFWVAQPAPTPASVGLPPLPR